MWTTPDKVRKRLGLTEDEVPDEDIEIYIEEAQADMLDDLAYSVNDDDLIGSIDGTNTTFATSNTFIADKNFNGRVDSLDVSVYTWTNEDDPATKTSVTISTIYPDYAKIVLATAPASTITKITADYYYFPDKTVYDRFDQACSYLAAYYYANAEMALLPDQWMHGAYRFKTGGQFKELYDTYQKKIQNIFGRVSIRGEHDEATLIRGEN